jgi:hypothetical protein
MTIEDCEKDRNKENVQGHTAESLGLCRVTSTIPPPVNARAYPIES